MTICNSYFLVLDIETSVEKTNNNGIIKPNNVWLSYGVISLYDFKGNKLKTYRFRKWKELDKIFKYYNKIMSKVLVCYCHNLAYEFDFLMKNLGKPTDILANNSHQVITGKLDCYKHIVFRCSYQLSRMSLKKIGDTIGLEKLDSEYRTIYDDNEVTEEEWLYCERDCDIVGKYIPIELSKYKQLSSIPLTSTGKVRRDLKKLYSDGDWDLMPTEEHYKIMEKVFRGGLTLSNPRFTGFIINKKIRCFDEKSKYPSVMLSYDYPYNLITCNSFDNNTYKQFKFWIGRVKFTRLFSNYEWGTISTSTVERLGSSTEVFNGKIIYTDMVEIYITNIDFETISLNYHFDKCEFIELYYSDKFGKLPNLFIDLITMYAKPKYELSLKRKEIKKKFGEESKEYIDIDREYMESKCLLNGIYGMMVQKLTNDTFEIDENYLWIKKRGEYKYIENKHLKRNFLFGVYITSYSRRDLVKNIVYNCPDNFVYCDTDSIKFIDIDKEFIDCNIEIMDELKELPYFKGFNLFEEEESYDKFITYGAKKYAYSKKDITYFTVAGLPKTVKINTLEEFKLNTTFKNCKLAKRYIFNGQYIDVNFTDEEILDKGIIDNNNGGVALYETDYTLSMTSNDLYYIERNNKRWQEKNIQQNMLI